MIGENLPDYDNHSTAFYGNGDWCSCNIPLNNLLNVDPSTLNFQFWWDQQGFRSRHPGGAILPGGRFRAIRRRECRQPILPGSLYAKRQ